MILGMKRDDPEVIKRVWVMIKRERMGSKREVERRVM